MKKLISILMLSSIMVLTSCDKDEINNTDTRVGRSDVTVYPILTLNGSQYMAIPLNGTWTDPGAVAKEGSATIQYTTAGTVNTGAAGVYRITYTAANKDGFTASVYRWVAVYSTDATAAANDLSGNYARTTNASVASWTKIAPGVYKVFNPGGAPGTNLTVILFNPTGLTIKIPPQVGADGNTTTSSTETYTLTPAPPKYSMVIVNPGYGTALRTFVKQ
jgi:hypothetical protein